jgi:manganese efflux pump family protein
LKRTILRFVEIALVAIALGCDAFAVGMGVGTRFCRPRQTFRLSFHFGLFQFIMPILGWFVSRRLPGTGRVWGPWIAFALLFLIGAKMVAESVLGKNADPAQCTDPTRGLSLVILSVAASLDAFGVGFSLGILGAGLITPAIWFGVTAGTMTWVSMKLGNRLSTKFGRWVEAAGGAILMVLAVEFVV